MRRRIYSRKKKTKNRNFHSRRSASLFHVKWAENSKTFLSCDCSTTTTQCTTSKVVGTEESSSAETEGDGNEMYTLCRVMLCELCCHWVYIVKTCVRIRFKFHKMEHAVALEKQNMYHHRRQQSCMCVAATGGVWRQPTRHTLYSPISTNTISVNNNNNNSIRTTFSRQSHPDPVSPQAYDSLPRRHCHSHNVIKP